MRRLISMLAAGVLAAGTLFTTAGAASAGTAAVHQRADCSLDGSAHLNVTIGNTYYLGTPVNTFSGAVVRLKRNANTTTNWRFCLVRSVPGTLGEYVLRNRGLALTSRDFSAGGLVTVETTSSPTSNGFASQRWFAVRTGATKLTLRNEKTCLFLRIRNSGPFYGQTVTTGATPRDWDFSH
jgi:hypothetical protein